MASAKRYAWLHPTNSQVTICEPDKVAAPLHHHMRSAVQLGQAAEWQSC